MNLLNQVAEDPAGNIEEVSTPPTRKLEEVEEVTGDEDMTVNEDGQQT
jgi:hypothetical protein